MMYNRMQESGVGDEGNVNTQPVVSPVHQQTVYLRPSGQRTYKLSSKAFQGLGITQIVIALITIMCQVAAVAVYEQVTFSGVGFYCPVIYIIAGAFGIASSQRKTVCPTVTCLVLCVVAAVLTGSQFILGVMAALVTRSSVCDDCGLEYVVLSITSIFMALLAVVECVLAIVCASLCCKAVCCGYVNETMMTYSQGADGTTMIPLIVPNSNASARGILMAPLAPEYVPHRPDMLAQAPGIPPVPEKGNVA